MNPGHPEILAIRVQTAIRSAIHRNQPVNAPQFPGALDIPFSQQQARLIHLSGVLKRQIRSPSFWRIQQFNRHFGDKFSFSDHFFALPPTHIFSFLDFAVRRLHIDSNGYPNNGDRQMTQPKQTQISPESYFEMEEAAENKSEYFHGEIFAMTGASHRHNMMHLFQPPAVCYCCMASVQPSARLRRASLWDRQFTTSY